VTAVLIGAAGLQLALAFFASDLSVWYVWAHTRDDYPWYYRLSGVWASQEGTILLWGALLAGLLTAISVGSRRTDPEVRAWMQLVLAGLVAAFAWLMVHEETFRLTTTAQLRTQPHGRGLQEVLVTPFMVIHPPIQFVAYALAAMPAAAAFAGLITGRREWARPALQWARPAWFFSTLGLGLGGLWAYYVLNFGGYWAWDPVETANLLPWLSLTALLHAVKQNEKFGDFRIAAPALAIFALVLSFFSTFATRSGLWVSVHAFTDPTNKFNPDAAQRAMSILAVHWPSAFFVGLMAALAFAAGAAFLLAAARATPATGSGRARRAVEAGAATVLVLGAFGALAPTSFLGLLLEVGSLLAFGNAGIGLALLVTLLLGVPPVVLYVLADSGESRTPRVDLRTLMAAAVVLLSIALATTLLLDFQVINGMDRATFDVRAPWVGIPILLVLGVAMSFQAVGARRSLLLAGAALVLGVVAAFLVPDRWALAAALPPLVFALVASVGKLLRVNLRREASTKARWGAGLLLVGSLLGLVMWSNPPTRLPLPGGAVAFPAWGSPLLFGLALVGFLGAILAFQGRGRAFQVMGAVAGAVSLGYGVGALLCLASIPLLLTAPRMPRCGVDDRLLPALGPRLRQSGIYLVHVAVVLGLIGITASTYAREDGAFEVEPGATPVTLAGTEIVTGAAYATADSERYLIPLRYGPPGGTHEETEMVFFWNKESLRGAHYDSELNVQRGMLRDVYIVPTGIKIGERWIQGPHDTDFSGNLVDGEVSKVRFTVTLLPMMTLVWSGLWLMGIGMLLVLAGGLLPALARRSSEGATQGRGAARKAEPPLHMEPPVRR
ncbi:MAG TPA: cytochrome c biogenesis protein CcsA, partial [Candidatus Thermoplasmatota archaeon]|nr:cytochrome c biogenesis protein CcsA [Candidatus Thermoplasmatota archaeon]